MVQIAIYRGLIMKNSSSQLKLNNMKKKIILQGHDSSIFWAFAHGGAPITKTERESFAEKFELDGLVSEIRYDKDEIRQRLDEIKPEYFTINWIGDPQTFETIKLVKTLSPETKILYISSVLDEEITKKVIEVGAEVFFDKPTMGASHEAIKWLLNQ